MIKTSLLLFLLPFATVSVVIVSSSVAVMIMMTVMDNHKDDNDC